jgi:chromosome segregation ATPase
MNGRTKNRITMKHPLFNLIIALVACAILDSCVSRKKYDALTNAKRSVDMEIAALSGERDALEKTVKQLQDEFNATRYKLTENNAAKEKQIDELHVRLRAQENQGSALKTELQDAEDQAKYSEQTHKQRVADLEARLRNAVAERDEARKLATDTRTALDLANRKLSAETERSAARVDELTREVKAAKDMLSAARKTLESKDQELQKLIQQIEALKKQGM